MDKFLGAMDEGNNNMKKAADRLQSTANEISKMSDEVNSASWNFYDQEGAEAVLNFLNTANGISDSEQIGNEEHTTRGKCHVYEIIARLTAKPNSNTYCNTSYRLEPLVTKCVCCQIASDVHYHSDFTNNQVGFYFIVIKHLNLF